MTLQECIEAGLVFLPLPSSKRGTVAYKCRDCGVRKTASLANVEQGIAKHGFPRCNACARAATNRLKWLSKVEPYIVGEIPQTQKESAVFRCAKCSGHYSCRIVNWLRHCGEKPCPTCSNADPARCEKLSKAAKLPRKPHSKETRRKMSESAYARWESDQKSREIIRSRIKDLHKNEEWKTAWYAAHKAADEQRVQSRYESWDEANAKRSETMASRWEEDEFREKMLEAAEGVKEQRIETLRETLSDPIQRSRLSLEAQLRWQRPAYRKAQAARWTPEARKDFARQMIPHRSKAYGKRISSLEEQFVFYLDSLGYAYQQQYVVGPYVIDFFIPSLQLLVEVHGLKWHHPSFVVGKATDTPRKDKAKRTYIERHCPDFQYIEVWEDDMYALNSLRDLLPVDVVEFAFHDLTLRATPKSEAQAFLRAFHYKEHGRTNGWYIGAYLGDKLTGIVEYSSVLRKEMATSMGYKPKEALELSRFCLHPAYQKRNFASWLLARSLTHVRDTYPYVRVVVSYADTTWGHDGTIYKAANFQFVHTVKPDYHYEKNGSIIHKRTFWRMSRKLSRTETEAAEILGYKKVWGEEKLKFAYYLD